MILSKEFLNAQPLLQELERAYDEKTLKEFICDYVGWVGTLEDVYTAQKFSSKIEDKDISDAVRTLREEGLLKEEASQPYKQFCDICLQWHKEAEELVIENVNDLYFLHIGENVWDEAYDKFNKEYVNNPDSFYDHLRKISREEQNNPMNESLLNEFLSTTRLTTVGKILAKDKEELESDAYNKKLKFYKAVAGALGVKDVNELLVYKTDKASLATLIKDNLPKTKMFAKQTDMQFEGIKGRYFGDWGIFVTSDSIYIKNDGSFRQLDKFLDGAKSRMSAFEDEEAIEVEDAETDTSAEVAPDRTAEEIIHVFKTKSANFYCKVAQAPEVEKNKDFTDADSAVRYAKAVLDKKGYNTKDFKIEKHYDTAPEVAKVKIGDKHYKANDIAFVVDGRAYSYARYNALDAEKKAQAVVVARKGLINTELVEDFWLDFGDAEKCLEGVVIQVPEHIIIEFEGPEYLITNNLTDNYARGYVVGGDNVDKEEFVYNVCRTCSPVCRQDELLQSIKECTLTEDFESEANMMTVEDMLAGMMDNVSDAQLDAEITRFRKYARLLGMKSSDYDKLVCLVDDELDPVAVFDGARNISADVKADYKVNFYPEHDLIVEYANGNVYMFFKDETSCKEYYDMADKFLRSFEVDENPFNEDFTIDKDNINIQECLNKIDKSNNNKYDLLNCYLENKHTAESDAKLATMIRENASAQDLRTYIRGDKMSLFESDETNNDMSIEEFLQEATAVSDDGELTVVGEAMLNRACNWLDNEGFEFDTKELDGEGKESEFLIKWNKKESDGFEYSDEQNADNKRTALNILGKIREVEDMLLDICQSVVSTKMATIYDSELQDLLREALELAKQFNY